MIAKGCTVKNTFTIPFSETEIETIFITYGQKGEVVLEKSLADCTFDNGAVSVDLLQEDTLKFCDCAGVQIQIRVKLTNGTATKSNILHVFTDELLKDGVI